MRGNALIVLYCLLVALLLGVAGCGVGGNSAPPTIAVQTYPAKPLPAKFIAATAATSGIFTPRQDRLNFVRSIVQLSKTQGINAVNLILDWNDLEPQQGSIDYALLDNMITAIKSQGLYCILRIYVNVEQNWQAWPSWVSPSQTYISQGSNVKNILPWDSVYQASFELFQRNLANHFASTQIQPDAFQITVGGSYGEQVLDGYNWQAVGWDWSAFLTTLFNAEKQHVDMYVSTFGTVGKDHIFMVNSLLPSNTTREDEVGVYARNKGTAWIESNAGACFLFGKDYGPDNMRMLGRFKGGSAKIFLEDESGNWACPEVLQNASLSHRVDLMRQLQSTHGFTFDAVSINGGNGDLRDSAGISSLKQLLGL